MYSYHLVHFQHVVHVEKVVPPIGSAVAEVKPLVEVEGSFDQVGSDTRPEHQCHRVQWGQSVHTERETRVHTHCYARMHSLIHTNT